MGQNKATLTWQEKLEITEKNAIEFLGECFRVGGMDIVKIADLETSLDSVRAKEAESFAGLIGWISFLPDGKCSVTKIGLYQLRNVLRYSS